MKPFFTFSMTGEERQKPIIVSRFSVNFKIHTIFIFKRRTSRNGSFLSSFNYIVNFKSPPQKLRCSKIQKIYGWHNFSMELWDGWIKKSSLNFCGGDLKFTIELEEDTILPFLLVLLLKMKIVWILKFRENLITIIGFCRSSPVMLAK